MPQPDQTKLLRNIKGMPSCNLMRSLKWIQAINYNRIAYRLFACFHIKIESKGCYRVVTGVLHGHNSFRPPSLLVEGLLSTGPTPSCFYLLVEMGLLLKKFQYTGGEN